MAITVVTTEAELVAWVAARNAQGAYTEEEFAEIPDGVTINITSDLHFNPTNAGSYIAAIRRASAALITGRYFTIYGGTRPSISLRDYVTFTLSSKGRMRDLQLTRGTALGGAYRVGAGGQYERCILDAGSSPVGLFTDIAGGGKVIECLLIGAASVGRLIENNETVEFLRCGFLANGTANCARSNYGALKVVGCWDKGFTTNYEGTAAAGSGYNATSKGAFDGTGFGANGQTSLADADFVSVTSGSEDYKRAPGSTKLGNTGTVIAGLTTDAYGTALPQGAANDIGPYEYPEAGPSLTGNITGDDAVASGSIAPTGTSNLAGNLTADDAVASGTLTPQVSTVTTLPASRNPGNGARLVSIANVALAVLSDDANLNRLAGSAALNMGSDGRLAFANGVPVPAGTSVVVVTRLPGANGALGVERYITA